MFGLAQKFGTRDAPRATGELLTLNANGKGGRNYWWATGADQSLAYQHKVKPDAWRPRTSVTPCQATMRNVVIAVDRIAAGMPTGSSAWM
ncbi:MAG: hypothetical protein PBU97_06000 [Stenotrophomonas maltophilia]